MNLLVAGGAGYIGSIVTQQLIRAGHSVTVLDNLSKGHSGALAREARFVQVDLHDRARLDSLMSEYSFDAVLHFAAFIEAGESMVDPGRYFRNNVAGSLNLIDSVAAHGVEKIVFSSTAAVYAGKDAPLCESDELAPANAYGESKLMVERMLHWYHDIKGLRYASLRYFNACGAADGLGEAHQPETHLIPLVLQVALGQREAIRVFGTDYPTRDGTCVRDYIHVSDLATAHVLALGALERHETLTCNLGNGAGYSVRQVIDVAREVTGHNIPSIDAPRRPGDAPTLVADSSRARDLLGWQPRKADLREIIADAWSWHEAHPNGYSA